MCFSIYFTDVLPLKILIPELKRVLQPNGLFFHFGPLHYHFNEIEEMLTAEEIKDAFKAEGFEIITEDLEDLTHHHSEVSLSVKKYYNWIFAVRKKEVPVIKVHPDVILKMDKGFDYRATGNINSSSKGEEMKYQILLPSRAKNFPDRN